jgi:hypothetical protein
VSRVKKLLFLCALTLGACNSDSSNDGGTDATTEQAPDLCDVDAFLASGGNGNACPHASTRVCFQDPSCEASTGCVCKGSTPTWSCFPTPPECSGGCSLLDDGGCDAGDAAPSDASDGSSSDGSDAGSD